MLSWTSGYQFCFHRWELKAKVTLNLIWRKVQMAWNGFQKNQQNTLFRCTKSRCLDPVTFQPSVLPYASITLCYVMFKLLLCMLCQMEFLPCLSVCQVVVGKTCVLKAIFSQGNRMPSTQMCILNSKLPHHWTSPKQDSPPHFHCIVSFGVTEIAKYSKVLLLQQCNAQFCIVFLFLQPFTS